ncbi:MAG: transporter substrate-binding protein [Frankiales bacterium]|nr:transporter substrate-binding protein [Frankiales bacterium]
MHKKIWIAALGVVAATSMVTACSSSGKSTGGSGPSSSNTAAGGSTSSTGGTIKIGVLADLTGPSASGFLTAEKGIKAFVDATNKAGGVNGQQLAYVMGDTTSTAPGALTAAQKLVQTDKVFAIVEVSAFSFGAEPFLLKQGIPEIGGGFDGPIWNDPKNTNLFDDAGITNYVDYPLAEGQFFKAQGVTKVASLGYSDSKSSSDSVKAFNKSSEVAGMTVVYTNGVPFGSTDMGAIALKIKGSGADGLFYSTVPNTAFALNAALRQLGVTLKVASLPTGYGGDLLESAPAVAAAQGDFFSTTGLPAEANTPATQKRAADLAAVGVTGPPTFAEQEAYLSMTAFADGLKASGANPSREKFMTTMSAVTDFDGDGLLAPEKINYRDYEPKQACFWYVKLSGSTFQNVQGSPYCAATVPMNG